MFELNLPSIESSFTQPAPTNPSANIDKIDHISKIDSVIVCSVCVCAQGVKKKINRMQQHELVCLPWSCLCKLLTRFLFCLSFLLFFHSYDERTGNLSIGPIFDRVVMLLVRPRLGPYVALTSDSMSESGSGEDKCIHINPQAEGLGPLGVCACGRRSPIYTVLRMQNGGACQVVSCHVDRRDSKPLLALTTRMSLPPPQAKLRRKRTERSTQIKPKPDPGQLHSR